MSIKPPVHNWKTWRKAGAEVKAEYQTRSRKIIVANKVYTGRAGQYLVAPTGMEPRAWGGGSGTANTPVLEYPGCFFEDGELFERDYEQNQGQ